MNTAPFKSRCMGISLAGMALPPAGTTGEQVTINLTLVPLEGGVVTSGSMSLSCPVGTEEFRAGSYYDGTMADGTAPVKATAESGKQSAGTEKQKVTPPAVSETFTARCTGKGLMAGGTVEQVSISLTVVADSTSTFTGGSVNMVCILPDDQVVIGEYYDFTLVDGVAPGKGGATNPPSGGQPSRPKPPSEPKAE